jgi:hypothetical protein
MLNESNAAALLGLFRSLAYRQPAAAQPWQPGARSIIQELDTFSCFALASMARSTQALNALQQQCRSQAQRPEA